jgi:hypothetical protein
VVITCKDDWFASAVMLAGSFRSAVPSQNQTDLIASNEIILRVSRMCLGARIPTCAARLLRRSNVMPVASH